MIWSPLLMKYHEGIVFHAAALDGVSNALVEADRCLTTLHPTKDAQSRG